MSSLFGTSRLDAIKFRDYLFREEGKDLPMLTRSAVAKVVRVINQHSTLVCRIVDAEAKL
jgi:hypothetical protein